MSNSIDDIAAQALKLPPDERAKLIDQLIASIAPRSPSETEWLAVARKRRDEVRAGKVSMSPGDEALARVRARIS